jgi:hypothetical protein
MVRAGDDDFRAAAWIICAWWRSGTVPLFDRFAIMSLKQTGDFDLFNTLTPLTTGKNVQPASVVRCPHLYSKRPIWARRSRIKGTKRK